MAKACDSGLADPSQIVATAEPVLLPGYADLRSERESPDVGISVFSYKVPAALPVDSVTVSMRERVQRRHPCYKAIGDSSLSLQLRCDEPSGRMHFAAEIRAVVDRASQRAFVLTLNTIPADAAIYEQFVSTLDEAVQRHRGK